MRNRNTTPRQGRWSRLTPPTPPLPLYDTRITVLPRGGPVGLTLGILLQHVYNVPVDIVERQLQPTQHPQAHFMNLRTMEILRTHMPVLHDRILDIAAPPQQFNPKVIGVLIAHDLAKGEWVFQIPVFPLPGQLPQVDFPPDRCIDLIRAAAGSPSLDVALHSIGAWKMTAQVAAQYATPNHQVFLVGDAAHQFPPAGGFGMNTGIQFFKADIGYSYAPQSTDGDTSDAALNNAHRFRVADGKPSATAPLDTVFTPRLHVGQRLPHQWLLGTTNEGANVQVSSLDLVQRVVQSTNNSGGTGGPQFVLVVQSATIAHLPPNKRPFIATVVLHAKHASAAGTSSAATAHDYLYVDETDLTAAAAVLVRPDGHVAWIWNDVREMSRESVASVLAKI
ncbi:hypothetical protein DYB32_003663 [Aphanomyces invadans]|uniref:FAD-binding domain-containing protein n=1 Tax=Aphanomyces invadans TaxID=157072 RepID=A0A3R7D2C2_9STRA|nr:hypothetical protein DYB32_003663 [Aphanomyces invadans]